MITFGLTGITLASQAYPLGLSERVSDLRILLTGGTGFIGSHLLRRLIGNNHSVIILKRKKSKTDRIQDIIHSRQISEYDIDDLNKLDKILLKEKPELIIHLAAMYKRYHSQEDVSEMVSTNITLPTKILDSVKRYGQTFFINTGSFFEYKPKTRASDEQTPITPLNLYAATKQAFEQILDYYAAAKNIKAVTLKLFSPYGPGDQEYKLIPMLIRKINNGEPIDMTAGGQKLDYTYVEDIVEAYILSMKFLEKSNRRHEIFNIGSGDPVSLKDLAKLIAKLLNKPMKVNFGAKDYAPDEIMYSKADSSKASKFLNWSARHSLESGLIETIKKELPSKKDFGA